MLLKTPLNCTAVSDIVNKLTELYSIKEEIYADGIK